jgi:hypothetical protein
MPRSPHPSAADYYPAKGDFHSIGKQLKQLFQDKPTDSQLNLALLNLESI